MNTLSWTKNAEKTTTWLFLLGILKSYNVSIKVMINFYRVVIENILTTNILDRLRCTSKREFEKIDSIVWTAVRITGTSLHTIQSIYQNVLLKEPRIS